MSPAAGQDRKTGLSARGARSVGKTRILTPRGLQAVARVLGALDDYVMSLLVAAMTIVMGLQVVMRYVFNNSLTWSEELTRILFVWVVFLGAAAILKRGSHMGIDMLGRLPKQWRIGVDLLLELVALAFSFAIVWYGIKFAQLGAGQETPATRVSVAWAYAALPVGGALYLLRTVVRIAKLMRGELVPKSGAFGE